MDAENERLRAENERLRLENEVLRRYVREQGGALGTGLGAGARAILQLLPERFTADDLISLSEKMQENVFGFYRDIRRMVEARLLVETEEGFTVTSDLRRLLEEPVHGA